MSILIKGMEMPKAFVYRENGSFTTCPLYDIDGYCGALNTEASHNEGGKLSDCPLTTVPPHGDLIDKKTVSENLASVLNKKNPPFSYPDWNDAIVAMLTAPTIIEAEEEE